MRRTVSLRAGTIVTKQVSPINAVNEEMDRRKREYAAERLSIAYKQKEKPESLDLDGKPLVIVNKLFLSALLGYVESSVFEQYTKILDLCIRMEKKLQPQISMRNAANESEASSRISRTVKDTAT